ncbi:hypothetical protein [Lonepinella sp. BR2474]|uniref:hypothetical protein n=1 Tax=Lonepinella sp. BR2474 TaxID=3434548 RepID=UPI003F6DD70A
MKKRTLLFILPILSACFSKLSMAAEPALMPDYATYEKLAASKSKAEFKQYFEQKYPPLAADGTNLRLDAKDVKSSDLLSYNEDGEKKLLYYLTLWGEVWDKTPVANKSFKSPNLVLEFKSTFGQGSYVTRSQLYKILGLEPSDVKINMLNQRCSIESLGRQYQLTLKNGKKLNMLELFYWAGRGVHVQELLIFSPQPIRCELTGYKTYFEIEKEILKNFDK